METDTKNTTPILPQAKSPAIVIGATDNVICHKEATMNNTSATPALKVITLNDGTKVYETKTGKQFTKSFIELTQLNVKLVVANFGKINTEGTVFVPNNFRTINKVDDKGEIVLTANKTEYGSWHYLKDAAGKDVIGSDDKPVRYQAFGEYNGMLSALVALKTARPESIYLHGLHRAGGLASLKTVWEWNKDMEPLYVRWSFLDQAGIDLLASLNITKPTDEKFHNTWLAYTFERRMTVVNFHRVMPETWDVWAAEMAEKGISREAAYFTWKREHNWNEKDWNIINKHDALEVALMLTEGDQYVYLYAFTYNEDKGESLYEKLNGIITKDVVTLRDEAADKASKYATARRIVSTGARLETTPATELPVQAKDANAIVVYNREAEAIGTMNAAELVGKTVEFVYADGSPVDFLDSAVLYNLQMVVPAVTLAAGYNAYICVL